MKQWAVPALGESSVPWTAFSCGPVELKKGEGRSSDSKCLRWGPRNTISCRQLLGALWRVPGTAFLSTLSFSLMGQGPTPALCALYADPSFKALPSGQTNSPCSPAAHIQWARQFHWTQREVEQTSLVSHLPAINLLPKIAAEPWGIFIAATWAFFVLKDCKENFEVLACM